MKNLLKVAIVAAGILSFGQARAASTPIDTVVHKVKHAAKAVGHATAHAAATADAAVVDKRYDGKFGPEGQAIYINKHSHYYYVNKTGHRVYLKKSQLMDKPTK
jgi:outer membrane usher protein FimD/PapC